MFKRFRRNKSQDHSEVLQSSTPTADPTSSSDIVISQQVLRQDLSSCSEPKLKQEQAQLSVERPSRFFSRLKQGLTKTRQQIGAGLSQLVLGDKKIDEQLLEDIETKLLVADIGVETTQSIIASLKQASQRSELSDVVALFSRLEQLLLEQIAPLELPPMVEKINSVQNTSSSKEPFVICVVGINGSGKTTTIGKLVKQLKAQGLSVLLAAGDTFRAAAIEQLQTWGERSDAPVVAQQQGSDSASVVFDAISSAKAKSIDVVIADTAGRLHTQHNLMQELKKVKKVMQKCLPNAPHETMLVLDGSTGQNALVQAKKFHEAIGLDSITMTKLDGTAKGGVLFALARMLPLPIRFVGVGEAEDDLLPFSASDFVKAILNTDEDVVT